MGSERWEKSFYIVIYNSLGMSAFWEIHEKMLKNSEICGFFLGRALGVDSASILIGFWDHFGSSWVPKVGKKAIQKP